MKSVVVLGSGGMLGKAVVSEAIRLGMNVIWDMSDDTHVIRGNSSIINCVGAIPLKSYPIEKVIKSNSIYPLKEALWAKSHGIPFIHISTDCVFSGNRQPSYLYHANDNPDANDLYGRSKALGELCVEYDAMVLRTSFVGYDHGLLNWLLQQQEEIEGWEQAYWTGSSVYEVARRILEIEHKPGIYHLSSPKILSKCSVLEELRDLFQVPVNIRPVSRPNINRALYPDYELKPIDSIEVQRELLERRA